MEVHLAEVRISEVRLAEVHMFEIRFAEVRPAEVRPSEVRLIEPRPLEARPDQVRFAEVRSDKVRRAEVHMFEIRLVEVCPTEVRPPEIQPYLRMLRSLHSFQASTPFFRIARCSSFAIVCHPPHRVNYRATLMAARQVVADGGQQQLCAHPRQSHSQELPHPPLFFQNPDHRFHQGFAMQVGSPAFSTAQLAAHAARRPVTRRPISFPRFPRVRSRARFESGTYPAMPCASSASRLSPL